MGDVSFSVTIAGQAASEALLSAIVEIEVEEGIDLVDIARLKIATAVKDDGSGWTHADDDLFTRLAEVNIDVTVGDGSPQHLLAGLVVETSLSVSNEPGKSVLEVILLGPAALMGLEEKVRAFPDQADGDIVTTIASDYGFDTDVDSTQPSRAADDVTTVQRGTDLAFVRALAARNGFDFYVEVDPQSGSKKAHFHARRLDEASQGVLTVHMGDASNVDEVAVRFHMLKPVAVKAVGMLATSLEAQSADITQAAVRTLGAESTLGTDRPRKILADSSALHETGELTTYAQAMVDRAAWAVTAEGTVTTSSYRKILRSRRPVTLRGVGPRYSGDYFVLKVVHQIGQDSYKQRFSLARTATGQSGSEQFTDSEGSA